VAITYRAAEPEGYAVAAQLRFDMAHEMGSHDFVDTSSDWRERFGAYFTEKHRKGDAQLFLAYDGDVPVGMATVSVVDDYRRYVLGISSAWINAVYVVPSRRRQGVAKVLMDMATEWARAKGCRRIRLRSSDQGRLLYESLGFIPTSEMELRLH
jgi:GNAT superfamily N-acetyltransferase